MFFGRETIEVATFRATSAPSQGDEPLPDTDPEDEVPELDDGEAEGTSLDEELAAPASARREPQREADPDSDGGAGHGLMFDASGRILRDNVYGTIEEDVWRRDFTANALYYNIADFSLWDYVDGAKDIAARRLKLIGDPETRFREDPVRMLRAARFEAKLGFELDPATARPIGPLRELLSGVPPARLFDETLKLFLSGHGARSFEVLRSRGLLAALLPSVDSYFVSHPGSLVEKLLLQGLKDTDERVLADKPVAPSFLFALLLIRADRRHHRGDATGALARARHHPRGMRSRDARGADAYRDPQAFRARRARDVRPAAAPGASARPAGTAYAGASALPRRPTTCCCCAPSSGWRPPRWRSGGRGCRKCRRRSAGRMADALAGERTRAGAARARRAPPAPAAARRRAFLRGPRASWRCGGPPMSGWAATFRSRAPRCWRPARAWRSCR